MASHAVRKTITFCYGHRIAGHGGLCRFLHGHNARVEIECRGPLDEHGMVVDFGEIKRVLKAWIVENWDHRTLLQSGDPLAAALKDQGEPIVELDAPPTAENLAAHLYQVARAADLPVHAVRFWETDTSMASYEGP